MTIAASATVQVLYAAPPHDIQPTIVLAACVADVLAPPVTITTYPVIQVIAVTMLLASTVTADT